MWIRLHVPGQSTALKDEGNRLPRGSTVQLFERYICSRKVEQPWYHLGCIQMKHYLEVRSVLPCRQERSIGFHESTSRCAEGCTPPLANAVALR